MDRPRATFHSIHPVDVRELRKCKQVPGRPYRTTPTLWPICEMGRGLPRYRTIYSFPYPTHSSCCPPFPPLLLLFFHFHFLSSPFPPRVFPVPIVFFIVFRYISSILSHRPFNRSIPYLSILSSILSSDFPICSLVPTNRVQPIYIILHAKSRREYHESLERNWRILTIGR